MQTTKAKKYSGVKRGVCRGLCLLLAAFFAALLPFSLTGCNFGGPSDEEARAILEENLEALREITDIIYGEGVPLIDGVEIDPSWTTQHYFKVHPDFKYQTIAELKAVAEELFTEEYLEPMYDYAFHGTDDFTSRFGEDGGVLTMDVMKEPMGLLAEIYPETAKVVSGSRFACKVEVECLTETGSRVTRTISMSFVTEEGSDGDKSDGETKGRWKFDSAVF